MKEAERFKVGDRVRLIKNVANDDCWQAGSLGTIVREFAPGRDGAGHGKGERGSWPVRWDKYDYRLTVHPQNCHRVAPSAIEEEIPLPTEEEILALFAPKVDDGRPLKRPSSAFKRPKDNIYRLDDIPALAEAFDEGVRQMARAAQGGPEPVNPYRMTLQEAQGGPE